VTDVPVSKQIAVQLRPLRVVSDANIFTGRSWVERLIRESEGGRVHLYWSPKILEEVGRTRLWIWIKKAFRQEAPPSGSSGWKALWARYSEEAHAWFARISPLIRATEDQPPHEPAWAAPLQDPNDAWLWNTARRVDADLVVTMNLKDGPPTDTDGSRIHEGIAYVHPRVFMLLLDVWGEIHTSGEIPDDLHEQVLIAAVPGGAVDVPAVVTLLRAILARIAAEAESA
jgi:hypothetical protein